MPECENLEGVTASTALSVTRNHSTFYHIEAHRTQSHRGSPDCAGTDNLLQGAFFGVRIGDRSMKHAAPPVTDLASLPVVINVEEIANLFRTSDWTVRRHVREGTFRPRPFKERPYRWLRSHVEQYFRRERQATGNSKRKKS